MIQATRTPNAQIARAAQQLLAEYVAAHGPVLAPPVPFELIAEWLELAIERLDLTALNPDALGGISFQRRTIYVTPTTFVGVRYGFTVCHELGHWRLHQHLANRPDSATSTGIADIICRDSDRSPIEREADIFAANLLMPEGLLVPIARAKTVLAKGTIDRLAARFRASSQAMERRLRELGLIEGKRHER